MAATTKYGHLFGTALLRTFERGPASVEAVLKERSTRLSAEVLRITLIPVFQLTEEWVRADLPAIMAGSRVDLLNALLALPEEERTRAMYEALSEDNRVVQQHIVAAIGELAADLPTSED